MNLIVSIMNTKIENNMNLFLKISINLIKTKKYNHTFINHYCHQILYTL